MLNARVSYTKFVALASLLILIRDVTSCTSFLCWAMDQYNIYRNQVKHRTLSAVRQICLLKLILLSNLTLKYFAVGLITMLSSLINIRITVRLFFFVNTTPSVWLSTSDKPWYFVHQVTLSMIISSLRLHHLRVHRGYGRDYVVSKAMKVGLHGCISGSRLKMVVRRIALLSNRFTRNWGVLRSFVFYTVNILSF